MRTAGRIHPHWVLVGSTEGEVRCACNKLLLRFFRPSAARVEVFCPRCKGLGALDLAFSTQAA
jgi:phage FluMu protein Com